jgi:4-hydroxy-3-methylbut-2-en-1-yl diphosphate reductase
MQVILAEPRGFCAGVERAIEIVEQAIELYGPPVYVRHEIVHNKRVVDELQKKGARFVEELNEIPEGAVTIFSAHGVSKKVADDATRRDLPVIDATCPLVAKVHIEAQRYAKDDNEVVLIGHKGHPEVEGTAGRVEGGLQIVSSIEDVQKLEVRDPDKVAYVTQTTLSVDDTRAVIEALHERFPNIVGPNVKDICYATQNRQAALRQLTKEVELILVLGAKNSSNSNRLREIGDEMGVPTYMIDDARDVDPTWFEGVERVGITAGASAPEQLVQELIERLRELEEVDLHVLDGIKERVRFKLPKELTGANVTYGAPHGDPTPPSGA